ncbi:MAG: hypothetical protein RBR45_12850 [Pseudomonas sp.]|nr:hypothetical protein [Pseudomonas sp.]
MGFWAAKYSLILTVIITGYWGYRAICVLINPIIYIPESGKEIELTRTAFGFVFNKKILSLSDYYGIRNRVHWGHYRHCQTELVGKFGNYLPVRVELMSGKINEDAKDFKLYFSKKFGFEARPDMEHI